MRDWTALFDRPGFQAQLSRRFGLERQTVNGWRKGIPIRYCAGVEEECKGEYRRWHFRPDDWHLIWPELIGTKGAPPIPTEPEAAVA